MKYLRYIVVGTQGFLSGLPYAALTNVLQIQFINENASIIMIGCLSLIGQIYLLKFLLAPMIDYYKIPLLWYYLGETRSWIVFNQIGLIISFFLMGLFSIKHAPLLIIIFATIAAIFSASQDVSIDKHRIEILNKQEINTGSAWYLIGFRIGLIFAGSILILCNEYYGWRFTYYLLSGIILLGMYYSFINYQIKNVKHGVGKQYSSIFKLLSNAIKDIVKIPYATSLLLFIALYGLGDSFTISVNNIFLLRYLKISTNELILYANTLNLVMLMISAIMARYLIARFPISDCLYLFGIGQLITLFLYMMLSFVGNEKPLVITAILLEGLFGGLTATATIILISYIVKKPFVATQYALLSALATLKTVILGPLAALIVMWLSWTKLYMIGMALTLPSIWLIYYLQAYLKGIASLHQVKYLH